MPEIIIKVRMSMKGLGTIVNVLAIIVAGGVGVMLRGKLKVRFQEIVLQTLGIGVLILGVWGLWDSFFVLKDGVVETEGTLLVLFALLVGTICGEALGIDKLLDKCGGLFKKFSDRDEAREADKRAKAAKAQKGKGTRDKSIAEPVPAKKSGRIRLEELPTYDYTTIRSGSLFVDGFSIATLICAINVMGLTGAISDAADGDPTLLYIKAGIDAVLVLVLATVYGSGATFAAIPVLLLEGGLTLIGIFKSEWLTPAFVGQMGIIMSVVVIAAGINLCFSKRLRAANLLPSLLVVPVYKLIVGIVTKIIGE